MIMGIGVAGLQCNRPVVARDRSLALAESGKAVAMMIARRGAFRVDGDAGGRPIDGPLHVVGLKGDDAEEMQWAECPGMRMQYSFAQGTSLIQPTLFEQRERL